MKTNDLDIFYQGFDHFFPEGVVYKSDTPFLKWKNKQQFVEDIKNLTEIDISSGNREAVKESQQALAKLVETDKPVEANIPQQGTRESQEAERQFRASAKAQADISAKEKTEASIRRQYEALRNKKIFAKIKEPQPIAVSESDQKSYEELKELAKSNQLASEIARKAEENIPQEIKDSSSPQDIKEDSQKIAERVVVDLRNGPETIDTESVLLMNLENSKSVIAEVISDPEIQNVLNKTSEDVSRLAKLKNAPETFGRGVVETIVGKNVATLILGQDPTKLSVEFQKDPTNTTHSIDLQTIQSNFDQFSKNIGLEGQTIDGAGYGQSINFGGGSGTGLVSLPKSSADVDINISQRFQSVVSTQRSNADFDTINSFKGYSLKSSSKQTNVASSFGKISSGFSKLAAKRAGIKASVGGAGSKLAIAAKGFKFMGVFSALASIIPPKDLKEYLPITLGLIVGVPVGVIIGPGSGLFAGISTTTVTAVANGGVGIPTGITSILSSAAGVIGSVISSTVTTLIGMVVTTTVVSVFVIGVFLFIINSGAYILPPAPVAESGFGPGQGGFACTTERTPTTIDSSVNSPIATRAWEIMEDMYQGFWCAWNRSPGDFPTDQITPSYAPHYPELFDEKVFAKNPNPTREEIQDCGECMFWCTSLVQKSYKENGYSIQYTLWSPTMYADFTSRNKILKTEEETPTGIKPGAVIFFDVDNGLNRIDHVGVVHSINEGGVKFLQSNAGTKDDFIPFGSNGLQDLPGITVVGVGNP